MSFSLDFFTHLTFAKKENHLLCVNLELYARNLVIYGSFHIIQELLQSYSLKIDAKQCFDALSSCLLVTQ